MIPMQLISAFTTNATGTSIGSASPGSIALRSTDCVPVTSRSSPTTSSQRASQVLSTETGSAAVPSAV
jgi:hypothetical protein